jgi:putative sigma-54 modulation protein
MEVDYTGRQIEITPAIKKFTEKHLKKIRKILGETIKVGVILTVEKHRHITEIHLKSRNFNVHGVEATGDMYNSITAVLDKIERQALRHKEKHVSKKRKTGETVRVQAPPVLPGESLETLPSVPRIIRSSANAIKPMSLDEAAEQVVRTAHGFMVFRNAESDRLSVIYRRKDGNLGLVEP